MNHASRQRIGHAQLVGLMCALPGVLLGSVIVNRSSVWVAVVASGIGTWGSWSVLGPLRQRAGRSARLAVVWSSVVVALLVALGFFVVAIKPGVSNRSVFSAFFDALTYGWGTLLTSPLPAFAEPRTLVPVALVCCLAAAGGVAALESRSRVLPLLPAAVAFLGALIVAGRQPFAPVVIPVVSPSRCQQSDRRRKQCQPLDQR
jgi:hypothetical protein